MHIHTYILLQEKYVNNGADSYSLAGPKNEQKQSIFHILTQKTSDHDVENAITIIGILLSHAKKRNRHFTSKDINGYTPMGLATDERMKSYISEQQKIIANTKKTEDRHFQPEIAPHSAAAADASPTWAERTGGGQPATWTFKPMRDYGPKEFTLHPAYDDNDLPATHSR